jgi:hypothetical protein
LLFPPPRRYQTVITTSAFSARIFEVKNTQQAHGFYAHDTVKKAIIPTAQTLPDGNHHERFLSAHI